MFNVADTPEKQEKCIRFLADNNIASLDYTLYFYIENEEGEIVGVTGQNFNLGAVLEPFIVKNNFVGMKLLFFMMGYFTGKGFKLMTVISNSEKVINIITQMGFQRYMTDNIYITHL